VAAVDRVKVEGGGVAPTSDALVGFDGCVAVLGNSSSTGGKVTVGVVGCVAGWGAFTSGGLVCSDGCVAV